MIEMDEAVFLLISIRSKEKILHLRQKMIEEIIQFLLQQSSKIENKSSIDRVRDLATRLEDYLWRSKDNIYTYNDYSTIKVRLKSLADKIEEDRRALPSK
jgi:hypothetical protein